MRLGTHETRLLKFALRYRRNWHSWAKDSTTNRAVKSLETKGLLVTNEFRQFKLAPAAY